MTFRLEALSVSSILESVIPTTEPLAKLKHNTLVVQAGEDYTFVADRTRFCQVLLNLLSNACKFTDRGSVTLEVSRKVIDDQAWACWSVTDTGIGIAQESYDKLFRSFSQVDSSATRKHEGTGLGLAISKTFCERMGGTIGFSSEPGKGSQFTVLMPMSAGVAEGNSAGAPVSVGTLPDGR
jgi:signal transduction histidine kinase